ncbi:MAG TPA: DUF3048 domain-containing protein, partial [Bacillota bacterium]|nr:DUF3048 domain-containing protein [Bacillota bacterium]
GIRALGLLGGAKVVNFFRSRLIPLAFPVLLIMALFLVSACSKSPAPQGSGSVETPQVGQTNPGEQPPALKDPALNPLTGLQVEKANLNRMPLAIMVENSPAARPQSGLQQADLIYEVVAEGGITRFLAIFYGGDAAQVGPVRSARPYFLERSMEYKALYVHAGGSPEALEMLKKLKAYDLNQFANNFPFWRSRDRKAPHNLYGDTLKMRQVANKKWPAYQPEVTGFDFVAPGESLAGGSGINTLTIHFGAKASEVTWKYDESTHKYLRFYGNTPHKDKVTGKQYTCENILIQKVSSKVIDGEGLGTKYYQTNNNGINST